MNFTLKFVNFLKSKVWNFFHRSTRARARHPIRNGSILPVLIRYTSLGPGHLDPTFITRYWLGYLNYAKQLGWVLFLMVDWGGIGTKYNITKRSLLIHERFNKDTASSCFSNAGKKRCSTISLSIIFRFKTAHLWACPPSPKDDYIFPCHPADQRYLDAVQLSAWYRRWRTRGWSVA